MENNEFSQIFPRSRWRPFTFGSVGPVDTSLGTEVLVTLEHLGSFGGFGGAHGLSGKGGEWSGALVPRFAATFPKYEGTQRAAGGVRVVARGRGLGQSLEKFFADFS